MRPPMDDRPAVERVVAGGPTTDAELKTYLLDTFGVRLPDQRCCHAHTTPFRAFADAYFARASVTVWEASRGFGGKSFMLALLSLAEAHSLRARVNLLGGTGEQAKRVLEAMNEFWNYPAAPRHDLASAPAQRETRFRSGNWVRALMASTASARGPHPQRLRLDEVDEMTLEILDAAMGQTMSLAGVPAQTVLSSTHHYADYTFTEVKKRAAAKGWPVYEWCFRESLEPHGWLAPAEVSRKKAEVTEAMWSAEYELQEPNPEGRAIVPEAVEAMFKRELGTFRGGEGELVELEPPVPGARYATGGDWARKKDHTVIWTFRTDVTPLRLVAFERMQRRPWPTMVGKFDARMKRYPGSGAHDATGLGDVVSGYMTSDAEGVILVGRARADVFTEYIAAIERGECEAPMVDAAYGAHKYCAVDDLYGNGHPPDEFVAGALAYRASTRGRDPNPPGVMEATGPTGYRSPDTRGRRQADDDDDNDEQSESGRWPKKL